MMTQLACRPNGHVLQSMLALAVLTCLTLFAGSAQPPPTQPRGNETKPTSQIPSSGPSLTPQATSTTESTRETAPAPRSDEDAKNDNDKGKDNKLSEDGANSDPDKATLTGRVFFKGTPPAARKILITKDREICTATNTKIQDIVVGKTGGLANAVVEITGVKPPPDAPWEWETPESGYVLRQKNCEFSPSMLVVPNGAHVKVFNDDPVAHNVNTGAWNEMQPKGAPTIEKPIEGRSQIRVSCNIHSWMEAWIYPAQSPLFAVTDKDGKFKIKNIPPGRYRVAVWHPSLGKKRERVEFEAGKNVAQDFTYEAD